MEEPIVTVRGISKKYAIGKPITQQKKEGILEKLLLPYRLFRGMGMPFMTSGEKEFWALKDINFDLYRGERLGIIGRNGAGKTTLLKILSRLVAPTEGEARIRGRVTSLLGVGTGFNPNLTGRENIYLDATLHGLTRLEINQKFDEIVEFSGIAKFLDTPMKFYSSGMYSRLAFAVAAHLEPDILMLDEVLSAGDMAFQKKCLKKVEGMTGSGHTLIFVSHSMGDVLKFCDRTIWLEEGKIRFIGNVIEGVEHYQTFMTPSGENEINIEHRTERIGSGVIQIKSIGLYNENMKPIKAAIAGQDLNIVMYYQCDMNQVHENDKTISSCIYIENERSQRLFGMPNEILKSQRINAKPEGQLVCTIKNLPLVPGHYFISHTLSIGKDNAEKLAQSRSLVVLDGDFYGSGKLPHQNMGSFCVNYNWDQL